MKGRSYKELVERNWTARLETMLARKTGKKEDAAKTSAKMSSKTAAKHQWKDVESKSGTAKAAALAMAAPCRLIGWDQAWAETVLRLRHNVEHGSVGGGGRLMSPQGEAAARALAAEDESLRPKLQSYMAHAEPFEAAAAKAAEDEAKRPKANGAKAKGAKAKGAKAKAEPAAKAARGKNIKQDQHSFSPGCRSDLTKGNLLTPYVPGKDAAEVLRWNASPECPMQLSADGALLVAGQIVSVTGGDASAKILGGPVGAKKQRYIVASTGGVVELRNRSQLTPTRKEKELDNYVSCTSSFGVVPLRTVAWSHWLALYRILLDMRDAEAMPQNRRRDADVFLEGLLGDNPESYPELRADFSFPKKAQKLRANVEKVQEALWGLDNREALGMFLLRARALVDDTVKVLKHVCKWQETDLWKSVSYYVGVQLSLNARTFLEKLLFDPGRFDDLEEKEGADVMTSPRLFLPSHADKVVEERAASSTPADARRALNQVFVAVACIRAAAMDLLDDPNRDPVAHESSAFYRVINSTDVLVVPAFPRLEVSGFKATLECEKVKDKAAKLFKIICADRTKLSPQQINYQKELLDALGPFLCPQLHYYTEEQRKKQKETRAALDKLLSAYQSFRGVGPPPRYPLLTCRKISPKSKWTPKTCIVEDCEGAFVTKGCVKQDGRCVPVPVNASLTGSPLARLHDGRGGLSNKEEDGGHIFDCADEKTVKAESRAEKAAANAAGVEEVGAEEGVEEDVEDAAAEEGAKDAEEGADEDAEDAAEEGADEDVEEGADEDEAAMAQREALLLSSFQLDDQRLLAALAAHSPEKLEAGLKTLTTTKLHADAKTKLSKMCKELPQIIRDQWLQSTSDLRRQTPPELRSAAAFLAKKPKLNQCTPWLFWLASEGDEDAAELCSKGAPPLRSGEKWRFQVRGKNLMMRRQTQHPKSVKYEVDKLMEKFASSCEHARTKTLEGDEATLFKAKGKTTKAKAAKSTDENKESALAAFDYEHLTAATAKAIASEYGSSKEKKTLKETLKSGRVGRLGKLPEPTKKFVALAYRTLFVAEKLCERPRSNLDFKLPAALLALLLLVFARKEAKLDVKKYLLDTFRAARRLTKQSTTAASHNALKTDVEAAMKEAFADPGGPWKTPTDASTEKWKKLFRELKDEETAALRGSFVCGMIADRGCTWGGKSVKGHCEARPLPGKLELAVDVCALPKHKPRQHFKCEAAKRTIVVADLVAAFGNAFNDEVDGHLDPNDVPVQAVLDVLLGVVNGLTHGAAPSNAHNKVPIGEKTPSALTKALLLTAARRLLPGASEETCGVAFGGGGRRRGTFWMAGTNDPGLQQNDPRLKALRAGVREAGVKTTIAKKDVCVVAGGKLVFHPTRQWVEKSAASGAEEDPPSPLRLQLKAIDALLSFGSASLYELVALLDPSAEAAAAAPAAAAAEP